MPTTSQRGYPYPSASEPSDVPLDMQQLAEAVENDLETLAPSGLVPIRPTTATNGGGSGTVSIGSNGSVTATGATVIQLNGVFTSAYRNYKVLVDFDSRTVAADTWLHWCIAGVRQTDAVYSRSGLTVNNTGGVTGAVVSAGTSTQLDNGGISLSSQVLIELEVSAPAVASRPLVALGRSASIQGTASGWNQQFTTGYMRNVAVDGFALWPSSAGGLTGTVRVYGYHGIV